MSSGLRTSEFPQVERMAVMVERLCAPSCGGRAPGSREGEAARALLISALREAGIEPAGPVDYTQPVPGCGGANLIGKIPGSDAGSANERFVLVGAHYDHLGWHTPGKDAYWGADDNAAAVAIAIEVARTIAQARGTLKRTVLIALFDGEEPPFFLTRAMGSEHFARNPPVPLDRIDMMLCMDLVGHAVGNERHPALLRQSLYVFGAEKSEGTAALLDGLSESTPGVAPMRLGVNLIPPLSDYYPFQARQVPFLFLTSGRWRHYHQITDTPDRLDYRKMAATASYVERVIRAVAERDTRSRFLIYGNDDHRSLRTLWNGLSLIAPWSSLGREHIRVVERLIQKSRGRSLETAELEQVRLVLSQFEQQLA